MPGNSNSSLAVQRALSFPKTSTPAPNALRVTPRSRDASRPRPADASRPAPPGKVLGIPSAQGGLGALCGILTGIILRNACSGCEQKVESRLLEAEEKEAFKKRRPAYLPGSAGPAVLAVALRAARIASSSTA